MNNDSNYYHKIAVETIIDKERALGNFVGQQLDKTNNMFEYEGLPETVPAKFLELYLQHGGHAFFTKVEDKFYVFKGGLGGVPDEYYQPTKYTVANPYLKFSKVMDIGEEGILCRNDLLMIGIMPTLLKYGSLIIENLISFRIAAINSRMQNIINVSDDSVAESAKLYLKQVEDGKLGILTGDGLFENVSVSPGGVAQRNIIELIELNQYLLSQMYAELGIVDNYNMKRERLTSQEVDNQDNKVVISIENMYKERCEFCDKINEKYGLNIRVNKNERWGMDTERKEGTEDANSETGSAELQD